MSKGYSFKSFGATINCGKRTLYDWVKRFPDFEEAKDMGYAAALYFYEKYLIAKVCGFAVEGIDPKKVNNTCLIFVLKTRFYKIYGDRSKQEVEVKSGHDQIMDYLNTHSTDKSITSSD